ncbi:MAG: DUF4355 domain-containing protein [Peptoniphilaceae bacterium]|nr:DUF4355 domain-containing protein [Peptoniphilaceae bacterium]
MADLNDDDVLETGSDSGDAFENDVNDEKPSITESQLKLRLNRERKKALKEREKLEKLYDEKINALEEEFKLSKMNDEDKRAFNDKKKDELIEKYKALINRNNIEKAVLNDLTGKGFKVDDNILNLVIKDDLDSSLKCCDTLFSVVNELASKKVKENARTLAPSSSSSFKSGGSFNIAEFSNKQRKKILDK